MKVYVAYLSDRHCDAEIEVFANAADAIARAEEFMRENMAHTDHIEREKVDGYLAYFSYEIGGGDDVAYVVGRDVSGVAVQSGASHE